MSAAGQVALSPSFVSLGAETMLGHQAWHAHLPGPGSHTMPYLESSTARSLPSQTQTCTGHTSSLLLASLWHWWGQSYDSVSHVGLWMWRRGKPSFQLPGWQNASSWTPQVLRKECECIRANLENCSAFALQTQGCLIIQWAKFSQIIHSEELS